MEFKYGNEEELLRTSVWTFDTRGFRFALLRHVKLFDWFQSTKRAAEHPRAAAAGRMVETSRADTTEGGKSRHVK